MNKGERQVIEIIGKAKEKIPNALIVRIPNGGQTYTELRAECVLRSSGNFPESPCKWNPDLDQNNNFKEMLQFKRGEDGVKRIIDVKIPGWRCEKCDVPYFAAQEAYKKDKE